MSTLEIDLENTLFYNKRIIDKYALVLDMSGHENIEIPGNIVHGRPGRDEKFHHFTSAPLFNSVTAKDETVIEENVYYLLCFNKFGYSTHYLKRPKNLEIRTMEDVELLFNQEDNENKFEKIITYDDVLNIGDPKIIERIKNTIAELKSKTNIKNVIYKVIKFNHKLPEENIIVFSNHYYNNDNVSKIRFIQSSQTKKFDILKNIINFNYNDIFTKEYTILADKLKYINPEEFTNVYLDKGFVNTNIRKEEFSTYKYNDNFILRDDTVTMEEVAAKMAAKAAAAAAAVARKVVVEMKKAGTGEEMAAKAAAAAKAEVAAITQRVLRDVIAKKSQNWPGLKGGSKRKLTKRKPLKIRKSIKKRRTKKKKNNKKKKKKKILIL